MLTLNQIRTQVSAIRQRFPETRAVGLQVQERWLGPATFHLDGVEQVIVQTDSELAIREALTRTPLEQLVLLTSVPDRRLGEDVLARLARRKLFHISSTEILKELFKAKEIEPRLAGIRWMAEALAEARPPEGYPPVAGGRLDSETAWEMLLRHSLGFRSGKPDLLDLINWARKPESKSKFEALTPEAASAIQDWLKRHAGSPAGLVLGAMRVFPPVSIPALALACQIVFRPNPAGELIAAGARLEPMFGGEHPSSKDGQSLGETGNKWLIRELEEPASAALRSDLDAFDQLLRQLRIESFAHLSNASQTGLEQRLGLLGDALLAFTQVRNIEQLKVAESAFASVQRHHLANREPDRIQRAEMAIRLCRWRLRGPAPVPPDFAGLAAEYHQDGGFVDWARRHLFHGDSHPQLTQAYREILAPVDALREQQNQRFGAALVEWTRRGGDGLFTVEDLIPQVVAPLAKKQRVLLVVLDGLSLAIHQELASAFSQQGFLEAVPAKPEKPHFAVAGLPTTTEWSRRLLLVGREQAIASAGEEVGFRNHPALSEHNTAATQPVLFLKGSLSERDGIGLSEAVRRTIHEKRPVVGVVVNAIDDHLLKGDQLNMGWSIERVPLLQQLLAAATAADRVVVVTSDHGHVIEHNSETVRQEGRDRYRSNQGKPEPREFEIKGDRVAPFASGGFIAPWSERIIYTSRKNGYHGGISPQEVIVPLAVLAQEKNLPTGWVAVAQRLPEWWFGGGASPEAKKPTLPVPAPVAKEVTGLPLFDPRPVAPTSTEADWIGALLKSEVFKSQLSLAGRVAPSAEIIRKTLEAIEERGGSLLLVALSSRTGVPEFRLPGILSSLRRILNVEGYPVLSLDDTSGTVRLNRELLKSQFDLP
jgi:hypothetical protein